MKPSIHARVGEGAGTGRGCRRFPQRGRLLRGAVGMREDHEPAPPAGARALAHPRDVEGDSH